MADVIEPVGSRGEPIINVKSLRMRFEHGNQEGVNAEKSLNLEVATKASEGIKKFESLAKNDPGQKLNESISHSLSRSASGRGSIRIGSLRHKFESLANRSLPSDLFNLPGELDDDGILDNSLNNLEPVPDDPARESPQASDVKTETDSTPLEGEADVAADNNNALLPEPSTEEQGELAAFKEEISKDMSTFSVTSEDSFDDSVPALCLKDEIENAEACQISSDIGEEHLDMLNAEPTLTETKDTIEITSAQLLQAADGLDTPEGASEEVNESPALISNPSIVSTVPTQDKIKEAACVPFSGEQENVPVEGIPKVQDKTEGESDNCKLEIHSDNERIPIERSLPSPVKRGFFVRLFTCGTAI